MAMGLGFWVFLGSQQPLARSEGSRQGVEEVEREWWLERSSGPPSWGGVDWP